ncbi:MAG: peptide-methionine (S)-S-oxide reductase MsrA [Defluviitaleaceae bacterium]|nr:peptide-methionine (S)-S-oxide reductase MsrA [Defluviitaleaceae bacterium]
MREIYLAGGCFWGVDAYMARVRGVYSTESGYANGFDADPTTYKEVCTGTTGHTEAVYLKYDITKITLAQLLQEFFSVVDPTTLNRQAGDVGTQYRTGIYYTNPDDLQTIQQAIELQQQNYSKQIVTEVMPLQNYCPAEEYHQNYLEKNPGGYCHIKIV